LNNGGRIRGTVMEEHPQTGVRIQLADGEVRQVAASEVQRVEYGPREPAPPAPDATAAPAQPAPPAAPAPITQPQPIGAAPVTGYGAPMAIPPMTERRSKGAMIAGIVLLPLGFVAAAMGGVITGVDDECLDDPKDCAYSVPILWGFGSALMISGIVLVSVGAPKVEVGSAKSITLSPTPGGMALTGSF
jgi:hypothetical protein